MRKLQHIVNIAAAGAVALLATSCLAAESDQTQAKTTLATGKITRFPVVLVGSAYWQGLLSWLRERVQAEGKIHPEELDLIQVADDPEEVVEIIVKAHAKAGFDRPVANGDVS